MGGKSPEHEISLISGREVVNNINPEKYNIFPVVISKDGYKWKLTSQKSLNEIIDPLSYKGTSNEIQLSKSQVYKSIQNIPEKIDLVFIALHGTNGEDGTIQGFLETVGMKYTGSKVLASAIGMNKLIFKKIMENEGINIPPYVAVNKENDIKIIKEKLGLPPYFVKPHNQGSSVGTSVVKKSSELAPALTVAFKYSQYALVEKFIRGIELTCGVLGNENPYTLPLVEIVPKKSEYFDYNSKYTESGSEEIVPARISISLTKKIQNIALDVHRILGCSGFSRTDFILEDKKTPYVLEINTIPGLTPMSLLPKAAKSFGLSYPALLDKIISYALK